MSTGNIHVGRSGELATLLQREAVNMGPFPCGLRGALPLPEYRNRKFSR